MWNKLKELIARRKAKRVPTFVEEVLEIAEEEVIIEEDIIIEEEVKPKKKNKTKKK